MDIKDITELLELAKKATQARWHIAEQDDHHGYYIGTTGGDVCDLYFIGTIEKKVFNHRNSRDNAQYIASLSPDQMIPLLERYLVLEKKRIEVGDVLDWAEGIKGVLGTEYADRVTQQEARIAWAIRTVNDK